MKRAWAVIRPERRLATSEARDELPGLVRELSGYRQAAESLAEHAVEVGPRRQGGVWLVPEIDAQATLQREEALRRRVEELEDETENVAFALFLADRLERSSGGTTSGADFIRELGFDDLAEGLPG